MPARDNEIPIFNQIVKKYNPNVEQAKSTIIKDDLSVCVDFIWKEKDLTILFEVDSYNSAKNIFGEYVLLNHAKAYEANCILIIIHCYKNYNTKRTEKYIKFASDKLKCKLPFVVFSKSEWHELIKAKSKTQLINFIKKSSKYKN